MLWNTSTRDTHTCIVTELVNSENQMVLTIYQYKKGPHHTVCFFNDVSSAFMRSFQEKAELLPPPPGSKDQRILRFDDVPFSEESKIGPDRHYPDRNYIEIDFRNEDQEKKMAEFLSTHPDFADDPHSISLLLLTFQGHSADVSHQPALVVPPIYHQSASSSSRSTDKKEEALEGDKKGPAPQ